MVGVHDSKLRLAWAAHEDPHGVPRRGELLVRFRRVRDPLGEVALGSWRHSAQGEGRDMTRSLAEIVRDQDAIAEEFMDFEPSVALPGEVAREQAEAYIAGRAVMDMLPGPVSQEQLSAMRQRWQQRKRLPIRDAHLERPGPRPRPLRARLHDRLSEAPDGCLVFSGGDRIRGEDGRRVSMAQAAVLVAGLPLPAGRLRRSCGNGRCVRLSHLVARWV